MNKQFIEKQIQKAKQRKEGTEIHNVKERQFKVEHINLCSWHSQNSKLAISPTAGGNSQKRSSHTLFMEM